MMCPVMTSSLRRTLRKKQSPPAMRPYHGVWLCALHGSAAVSAVNFRKEIVAPRLGWARQHPGGDHEAGKFHGVLRDHGPTHLRSGHDALDELERESGMRVGNPQRRCC